MATLAFISSTLQPPVAIIVDGLSLDYPNPELISSIQDMLQKSGYRTEVYTAEDVTVEFYSRLPSLRPKLILLRIHGGILTYQGQRIGGMGFFAEPFQAGKYPEQVLHYLGIGRPFLSDKEYFVATFIYLRDYMTGRLDGATVIVMSCNSLEDEAMARVFIEKGASAYIGWTESVSPEHMDRAGLLLIRRIISEKMNVCEAVALTSEEVGPDPYYGGRLDVLTRG